MYNSKNIVNLSSYILSTVKLSILSKGLSYIPKPKRIDQYQTFSAACVNLEIKWLISMKQK